MKIGKILLASALMFGMAHAKVELTAELQGSKGNMEAQIDNVMSKIEDIGFTTVAANKHIETFYYAKYKERNVEMLSFFGLINKEALRPLLIKNPNFGAYAPFNFLAYKTLDTKNDDNTWYGHIAPDTMLDIVGEKDEATRKEFKAMIAPFDELVNSEVKPTMTKKFEHSQPLPKNALTKMVMSFDEPDDMEEFVEEFIMDHDGRFAANEFIIAGFIDMKFEYDDLELDFEEYDAYWVSLLCHFQFSNSIFNRGVPQAGMFAPCSVFFYVPAGTTELHVGYASVENWINTLNITDPERMAYMRKIDSQVISIFKEMGFSLEK